MHGAKEGGTEGYRERVREIKGIRERDGEWFGVMIIPNINAI